jgi:hypothetical protein
MSKDTRRFSYGRVAAAALPVLPADVTLVMPGAFLAQVPASARLHLLALIFQEGGMEVLDMVAPISQ